jgi:nucleoid DNA-binding protein
VTERETIAKIVRKALEAGQTVEIDGLGTFEESAAGYQFLPQTHPEVFIAYVAEDLAPARRLCEALRADG